MERLVIASVQQRMRVFATVDLYRSEVQRFLRVAKHKNAELVLFPELGATMLIPPLLDNMRTALLKYAEWGRRRKAPRWQRYAAGFSWWLASLGTTNISEIFTDYLTATGPELWQTYCQVFGEQAQHFNVTVVAPSGYLPDPADGVVRNISGIFGRDGSLLGYQAKGRLSEQDRQIAEPGTDWAVIETEVGALGLLLGNDLLYPEIGRLLAYKGADILLGQGAAGTTRLYQKLRAGLLARMQDNQLFAAASFLVGPNDLAGREKIHYVGRSAVFAPQELTPRFDGVLVEMGSPGSEGVLAADWNYVALRKLWDLSETALRRDVSHRQIDRIIASLYARLQHAPDLSADGTPITDDDANHGTLDSSTLDSGTELLRLDELPVTTTITRRWPPNKVNYSAVNLQATEIPELARTAPPTPSENVNSSSHSKRASHSAAEDETEEMDALPESQSDEHRKQNQ